MTTTDTRLSIWRDRLRAGGPVLVCVGLAVVLGFAIVRGGMVVAGLLIALPPMLAWVMLCVNKPMIGLKTYFHASFIIMGIGRFVPLEIPYGMIIDGVLLITLIGTLLTTTKKQWPRLQTPVFYCALAWFAFTLLQLINPETRSREAWFYAVRGVSFYWIQAILTGLVVLYRRADLNSFINIWLGWSLVAALWAFKQQYIGLSPDEQVWLTLYGGKTHMLFGHLRSFSIYVDAGQFGAAMAHVALFCLIRTIDAGTWRDRLWYGVLMAIYFWGFAVSGSRGPLFVIAAGFMVYLLLRKNVTIVLTGIMLGIAVYGALKFTTIGQGNYQVQRMRSALDPNDASLQVRLDNQKKLATYLASRPLGGGIGSGGDWGRRFSPGSFLAETALDSWYVKIWVETGIIGLLLHIGTLLVIIVTSFRTVWRLPPSRLRSELSGLLCGLVGIACASYGNQVFGQIPTSMILYTSMVFLALAPSLLHEPTGMPDAARPVAPPTAGTYPPY